jgi:hypothetical protein
LIRSGLPDAKRIEATLFSSAVRRFGKSAKELDQCARNEQQADFRAVFLSESELKKCRSDAADA